VARARDVDLGEDRGADAVRPGSSGATGGSASLKPLMNIRRRGEAVVVRLAGAEVGEERARSARCSRRARFEAGRS